VLLELTGDQKFSALSWDGREPSTTVAVDGDSVVVSRSGDRSRRSQRSSTASPTCCSSWRRPRPASAPPRARSTTAPRTLASRRASPASARRSRRAAWCSAVRRRPRRSRAGRVR